MTIVIIILLALIYWRLHDIVTAIHFQGTIFDHEDYFNDGWLEDTKPKKSKSVDKRYKNVNDLKPVRKRK